MEKRYVRIDCVCCEHLSAGGIYQMPFAGTEGYHRFSAGTIDYLEAEDEAFALFDRGALTCCFPGLGQV